MLWTALLMLIKGGQHGFIRDMVRLASNGNKVIDRLLDGKILSSVGFAVLCSFYYPQYIAMLCGLGWLGGVAPSIGEELGAIGGVKGNWYSDRDSWFGSKYFNFIKSNSLWGWCSGSARGLFLGLCLFLPTSNYMFLLAGAMMPVCYYIGISLMQIIKRRTSVDWVLGEAIYGFVLGLPLWMI